MKFNQWFKKQFGALPMSYNIISKLEDKAYDFENRASIMRKDIRFQKGLTSKYNVARLAWNIFDKDKK